MASVAASARDRDTVHDPPGLAAVDPQQGRVVDLRCFGGLTVDETAEALQISPATVKREWALAKAWLYQQLSAT